MSSNRNIALHSLTQFVQNLITATFLFSYGGKSVMTFRDVLGDGMETDLSECPPVYIGVKDPLVPADKKKTMEDNVV